VFVRDTTNLVPVLLVLWMFLTPVFWPPALLEKGLAPGFATLLRINPMYHVLEGARGLCGLYDRPGLPSPPLPLASLGIVLGCGLVTLLLGYAYFLGARRRFVDEI
jgi:ABC-type polysaccharide/polyol phosphate export permease